MRSKLVFILILSLFSFCTVHASPEVGLTCGRNDLPTGKIERHYLLTTGESFALVMIHRKNSLAPVRTEVLARDLSCVFARQDPYVVNCLRPTAPGSVFKADASLTIIRFSYLTAGPHEGRDDERDYVSENYQFYFRDDRSKRELKWHPNLQQCRNMNASEIRQVREILR